VGLGVNTAVLKNRKNFESRFEVLREKVNQKSLIMTKARSFSPKIMKLLSQRLSLVSFLYKLSLGWKMMDKN
jgi:hypothetical protein